MANITKEKFKTTIGGQALIEGIMMRGPKLDAIAVRGKDGLQVETTPRKVRSPKSVLTWPVIRGAVNFFDAQVVGIKAIMRSADLSPEEEQEPTSKFDKWLSEKMNDKKNQNTVIGFTVAVSLLFSVALFFLAPMLIGSFFDRWIESQLLLNLLEGFVRIIIFMGYMVLSSCAKDVKRVYAYHGAEHKTIRCYEAGLPLTVENVRVQTRKHPRCGTSFLLVIVILSILIFSVASSLLLTLIPELELLQDSASVLYKLIMIAFKLILVPVVVAFGYELNRLIGRYDNWFTRILTAPGLWAQNITTYEPDDSMIEVAIEALKAVIPEEEGTDLW